MSHAATPAAVDLTTSAPLPLTTSYRPGKGNRLETLAVHGDTAFAAETCDGRGCAGRQISRIDLRTGRVRRWPSLSSTGEYYALAVHGRRLYVGGNFSKVGGHRRSSLAAIDTRTGRVTRWRLDTNNAVFDLAIDGHTLYVIGSFTRAGGQRRPGVAAVDLRSGRLTSWRPRRTGIPRVNALAVTARRVYLAGEFGRGGLGRPVRGCGQPRRRPRRALEPPGRRVGVSTLAVIDNTVYAGGRFTSISGVPRRHIAALDARTLRPTPWNPGANGDVQRTARNPRRPARPRGVRRARGRAEPRARRLPARAQRRRSVAVRSARACSGSVDRVTGHRSGRGASADSLRCGPALTPRDSTLACDRGELGPDLPARSRRPSSKR